MTKSHIKDKKYSHSHSFDTMKTLDALYLFSLSNYYNILSNFIFKKSRCDTIANETTLHKRPNDTEINNMSPYGLQQLIKPIVSYKSPEMTIRTNKLTA